MKSIITTLQALFLRYTQEIFSNESLTLHDIQITEINANFKGDYTLVLFALSKKLKQSPQQIADLLITTLSKPNYDHIFESFELVQGFLNFKLQASYLWKLFNKDYYNVYIYEHNFIEKSTQPKLICLEYSSPNTNKPLHLGHLRNNFLGMALCNILEKIGHTVVKTCIVNDRGIHICKSMLAWQLYGNNETPQSTGLKGDHFVGNYYVKFNEEYQKQIQILLAEGASKPDAEKNAPILLQAQNLLKKWEDNDHETLRIWEKMNNWVLDGFKETYLRIGSKFDKTYFESKIYKLGKNIIKQGLQDNILYQDINGAVCIDLTQEKLDNKVLQRADGTAIYITQDLALADLKYQDIKKENQQEIDQSIYVVGNEQNHHFEVLKHVCIKLQIKGSQNIYHLSYGMVELPTGKMKSREGTVVDADNLIDDLVSLAKNKTLELNKGFKEDQVDNLAEILGIASIKFFLLRMDPKNKMVFNPEESLDFKGFTAAFIQYTYVRIRSLLEKNNFDNDYKNKPCAVGYYNILENASVRNLLKKIFLYNDKMSLAATMYNPAILAQYIYDLCQLFNSFYNEVQIKHENDIDNTKTFLLMLSFITKEIIYDSVTTLGITLPNEM
ncbi:MAG: arginine--tRNA ligase [Alphaproteobacteria bacterium]|nr:arginine--tRNA ligase [Alphaproteobacteria bacterium]